VTAFSQAVGIVTFAKGSSQQSEDAKATIGVSFRASLLWLLVCCSVLYLLAPFLIRLVFGAAFDGSIVAFRILLPGTVMLGLNQVLYNGASALGRPGLPSCAEGISVAITAIGLYLLVPRYGYIGAAVVSSISYMMSFAVMLILAHRLLGVSLRVLVVGGRRHAQTENIGALQISYFHAATISGTLSAERQYVGLGMTMKIAKDALRQCLVLVGRRNLYRTSRFLMRAARGDVANDPLSNGEHIVQTLALRTAVPPATVFDVGANVGEWTGNLLDISATLQIPSRVYAFEPCRETFTELSDRAGNWPNVTLINEGCSRHAGIATMHVYGSGFGTNSLSDPIDDRRAVGQEVHLTTIDLYCKANAIDKIDLLKIDAEGHDFEVIAGASEMLDRQAVRILQFEYNHCWIGSRNYLRDVFSFLIPKGYMIGKLAGHHVEFYVHWQWELETYTEGNYIACSQRDAQQFPRCEPNWLSFARHCVTGSKL
jgi:FkbM family methyltransferase